MYTENNSLLDAYVYDKLVIWIHSRVALHQTRAELWLGGSAAYSVFVFVMLWIEVGYWPWWMFVILWIVTEISMICTSIAMFVRVPQDRSALFETLYWAHVTFSTHASVLGALHVLDVGAWGTLFVTTVVGTTLYAPIWRSFRTDTVTTGTWTSPTEIRVASTTFALCFAPFHQLLHGKIYGSIFAMVVSLILLPSVFYAIYQTLSMSTERREKIFILVHFSLAFIPSAGMAWWTWLDAWLATAVPVTFAGILVMVNTEVIARTYYDCTMFSQMTLLTPLEFVPFIGVANAYLDWIPQPLSIVIIYTASALIAGLFLLRVAYKNATKK